MGWEEEAKRLASQSLSEDFEIYDFQIGYFKGSTHLTVKLDKKKDPLGSPTVEECAEFSQSYKKKLDELINANLYEEKPKEYTLEVSSPGACRTVKLPHELQRFKSQPMKVKFVVPNKQSNQDKMIFRTEVLEFKEIIKDKTSWGMADIKFNRKQGKVKKNKKSLSFELPLSDIKQVNLFLDV